MNISRHTRALACIAFVATLFATAGGALAQNTNSNIANTRHNLSSSASTNRVYSSGATSTNQICVFCHTPHAANAAAPGPLWNRNLSTQTYTPYTSNSLDSEDILNGTIGQPGGASKLCLSCHDGTLAIGQVSNSPGSGTGTAISMTGTRSTASAPFVVGGMPAGSGDTTGYTRNLGINLTNDHPISFTFQDPPPATTTDTLSRRDGELRSPPYSVTVAGETKTVVGIRSPGSKPMLPLDHEGKVQCTSCHDPHLAASKFLRLNRFQQTASAGTTFNPTNDQICLGCHDKNKDNQGAAYAAWSNSAHADSAFTAYTYNSTAAADREFPTNIKVWEAGCLNCHDTHTVQGSRRLLRDGTNSTSTPKAGGDPAIEETCYQCHSSSPIIANTSLTATAGVPDIKTEFNRPIRMPITDTNQPGSGTEGHDIGGGFNDATFVDCTTTDNKCGADFMESREKLGLNNHTNRHVECTDCHNPHRVIKNALFNGTDPDTRRTHKAGGANGNLASGALRGTWGVEPQWAPVTNGWPEAPTTFYVKRGDPGNDTGTGRSKDFLTREYQLCLKCHSNYGAGNTMPSMNNSTGGTPSNTNSIGTNWTNVAAEFTVAANDAGTGADQGAAGDTNGNKRSWHPVHFPTGRNRSARGMASSGATNIRAPFVASMGTGTMHCSDCHGNSGGVNAGTATTTANLNSWAQDTGPNLSRVQGPHGSDSNFLLRGIWSFGSNDATPNSPQFCGNCHQPSQSSGFDGGDDAALHTSGEHGGRVCRRCHIAVPHGWKNKAFLVNLRCVQSEAGGTFTSTCSNQSGGGSSGRTYSPYYVNASLSVATWAASGSWGESNCSGKDYMTNNCESNP